MMALPSKLPSETLSATILPTNPITATIDTMPLPDSLSPKDVLINVRAAASNPKDWLHLVVTGASLNSGDDMAGEVVAVGSEVTRFEPGDRVTAFHPMGKAYGAYAEFAIAPEHTTLHIPKDLSFEEASTIPLVSMTAALTLFRRQGYTPPWEHDAQAKNQERPLLVYAATTSLGTYAIKLAKLAGIGPIIAIGGGSSEYLNGFLDLSQDVFLDYRKGMDTVGESVRQLVETRHLQLKNGIDAFNEHESWVHISRWLKSRGRLSVFSGAKRYNEKDIPEDVEVIYTFVGTAHEGKYRPGMPKQPSADEAQGDVEFAGMFFKWLEEMLRQGKYSGHPFEVISGGLNGVSEGLNRLRSGQAGGRKFVYQIGQVVEDSR
jgi:NADPH:quinone reductase